MSAEETSNIKHHKNRDKTEEALERQKIRDKKNSIQQLVILDKRLGTGIGANKERTRLTKMIDNGKE